MIHIYDQAAQLRKEIKYVNELHEKYFGKTERSAATNIGDVGPACNPERIGETMTEKLQPGLGSGALREALEKHEYMNGSCLCREFRLPPYGKKELDEWALVRGDWMRDIRWKYWLEHVLAALSLSSPTESRCTCFERADGIGPMHGIHDSKCPAGGSKKS